MSDVGFWERVFVGVDENANGELEQSERGILPTVVDWIAQIGADLMNTPLNAIAQYVPDTSVAAIAEDVQQVIAVINQWAPVDLMMTYVFFYYTAYFILSVGHFTLKAIPTIW